MTRILHLAFALLLCLSSFAQKKSNLQLEESTITFPSMRVYLVRELPLNQYPLIDLTEPLPERMHWENLFTPEDTNYLRSTQASNFISQGLSYDGEYTMTVTIKRQYAVVIHDSILPPIKKAIKQLELYDPAVSEDGKVVFGQPGKLVIRKKEIMTLLQEAIEENQLKTSLKQLKKNRGDKGVAKPSWSLEVDRIYLEINFAYPDQTEEDLLYPWVLELEQN